VLLTCVLVYGLYSKHARRVAEDRQFQSELAQAEIGNPVLTIPTELPMDSRTTLAQMAHCRPGLFGVTHKLCQGNGILFGIPAYVAVEKLQTGQLYSVTYSFESPAKGVLLQKLASLFGPAHRFDSLDSLTPAMSARGWCWPLGGGQEVVLENEDPDDQEPEIAVYIESEVAANLYRLLEAIRGTCRSHPLLPLSVAAPTS
jgi:hypothetical protein